MIVFPSSPKPSSSRVTVGLSPERYENHAGKREDRIAKITIFIEYIQWEVKKMTCPAKLSNDWYLPIIYAFNLSECFLKTFKNNYVLESRSPSPDKMRRSKSKRFQPV